MNKRIRLFFLILISCTNGCSLLDQYDFVISKDISTIEGEKIYYDVYQTGLDNYTFEFRSASSTDTARLFEAYVNDAVYTAMRFKTIFKKDTVLITTNFPTGRLVGKTKKGTLVILERDLSFVVN